MPMKVLWPNLDVKKLVLIDAFDCSTWGDLVTVEGVLRRLDWMHRYNGALTQIGRWDCTVLNHSMWVSQHLDSVSLEATFLGLVHDWPEVFISDIPTQLKDARLHQIETAIMLEMAKYFRWPASIFAATEKMKEVDLAARAFELETPYPLVSVGKAKARYVDLLYRDILNEKEGQVL